MRLPTLISTENVPPEKSKRQQQESNAHHREGRGFPELRPLA
ncbi:MAG: hypothetical protein ACRD45_16375 [Bryobacteraceae bacterium]